MDLGVLIILAVVLIALAVAAITWFGPRPRQWESHDMKPTEEAKPLQTLTGVDVADEATVDEQPDEDDARR